MGKERTDDEPSSTRWERHPGADDDPTVVKPTRLPPDELSDHGPTVIGVFGPLDEVHPDEELTKPLPPGSEPTVLRPASSLALDEATTIRPPPEHPDPASGRKPGPRRMVLWKPPPGAAADGAAMAAKSGLAGLAVGLAVLIPVTVAAVLWRVWGG